MKGRKSVHTLIDTLIVWLGSATIAENLLQTTTLKVTLGLDRTGVVSISKKSHFDNTFPYFPTRDFDVALETIERLH